MDTLFNLGTKTRLSAFGAQTGFDHFIQIWTQYRIEQAQWCNDNHRGSKRIGCSHREPGRPNDVTITTGVRNALAGGPAAQ